MPLHTERAAIILAFPRRRGRPRSAAKGKDTGTPELALRRQRGETQEPLDYCLQRRLITPEQHWCGIHLRWLYTLRHGAPTVRAVDTTHFGGHEVKTDDPQWRAAREQEYHEAIMRMRPGGHAPLVVGVCVYNERPAFMKGRAAHAESQNIIGRLCEGLDILVALWGRQPGKRT